MAEPVVLSDTAVSRTPPSEPVGSHTRPPAPSAAFDEHVRLDFRALSRLDMGRVRACDHEVLASLLGNVAFASVSERELTAQSDDNMLRLVHYAQSALQYMMHVQTLQAAQLEEATTHRAAAEAAAAAATADAAAHKRELHMRNKTVKAYETALAATRMGIARPSGSAGSSPIVNALGGTLALTEVPSNIPGGTSIPSVIYKCAVCPKAFRGAEFLDDHVKRRHPDARRSAAATAVITTPAPSPGGPDMSGALRAAEAALAEVRAARDALAKELEERNRQLSEALQTARTATAALEAASNRPASTQVVNVPSQRGDSDSLVLELRAQLQAQAEDAARREADAREAERAATKQMLDESNRGVSALRARLAEVERALADERSARAGQHASRAGPLMDADAEDDDEAAARRAAEMQEAARRASLEAGERVAAAAAAAVAQHITRVETRIDALTGALESSEAARTAREEALSRSQLTITAPPSPAPEPAQPPPPMAEVIPAPVTAPVVVDPVVAPPPAPLPVPAFVLTYAWQRLPDDVAAWTTAGGGGQGVGAGAFATIGEAPGAFGVDVLAGTPLAAWRAVLPAETQVSNTNPPRVRAPPQWDLRIRVPRDDNATAVLTLFASDAAAATVDAVPAPVTRGRTLDARASAGSDEVVIPPHINIPVRRTSTIGEVRAAVAARLKLPLDVFVLGFTVDPSRPSVFSPARDASDTGDAPAVHVLRDDETVESAELFTRRPVLVLAAMHDADMVQALVRDYLTDRPHMSDAMTLRMRTVMDSCSPAIVDVMSRLIAARLTGPPAVSDADALARARAAVEEEAARPRTRSASPQATPARAAAREAQLQARMAAARAEGGLQSAELASLRATSAQVGAQLAAAQASLDYAALRSRGTRGESAPAAIRRERVVESYKPSIVTTMASLLSTALTAAVSSTTPVLPPTLLVTSMYTHTTMTSSPPVVSSSAPTPRAPTPKVAAAAPSPASSRGGGIMSLFSFGRRKSSTVDAPPVAAAPMPAATPGPAPAPAVTVAATAVPAPAAPAAVVVAARVPSVHSITAMAVAPARAAANEGAVDDDDGGSSMYEDDDEDEDEGRDGDDHALDEAVLDAADQYQQEAAAILAAQAAAAQAAPQPATVAAAAEPAVVSAAQHADTPPAATDAGTTTSTAPNVMTSASHRVAMRPDADAAAAAVAAVQAEDDADRDEYDEDEDGPDEEGMLEEGDEGEEDEDTTPPTHAEVDAPIGDEGEDDTLGQASTSLTTLGLGGTTASAFGGLEHTLETQISDLSATGHTATAALPSDDDDSAAIFQPHDGDAAVDDVATAPHRLPARMTSALASQESLALSAMSTSTSDLPAPYPEMAQSAPPLAHSPAHARDEGAHSAPARPPSGDAAASAVTSTSEGRTPLAEDEDVVTAVLNASSSGASLPPPRIASAAPAAAVVDATSARPVPVRSAQELLNETDASDAALGATVVSSPDVTASTGADLVLDDADELDIEAEYARYVPSAQPERRGSAAASASAASVLTAAGSARSMLQPGATTATARASTPVLPAGLQPSTVASASTRTVTALASAPVHHAASSSVEDILEDLDDV